MKLNVNFNSQNDEIKYIPDKFGFIFCLKCNFNQK